MKNPLRPDPRISDSENDLIPGRISFDFIDEPEEQSPEKTPVPKIAVSAAQSPENNEKLYEDSEYQDNDYEKVESPEVLEKTEHFEKSENVEKINQSQDERALKTKLNARFRRRKVILDRVCSILPAIAEMKRNGTTFEQLLEFHKRLHV